MVSHRASAPLSVSRAKSASPRWSSGIRRREALILLGGLGASWPSLLDAQQPGKVHKVGIFSTTARPGVWHLHQALIDSLRQGGYVEGKNVSYEHRFAEGMMDRLPAIAAELVSLGPDIVVAGPNTTVLAVRRASSTVPIVMTYSAEPVASGIIASLSRPGGNITGLTSDVTPETYGLRLQLLKEISPTASRVAALWNPNAIGRKALRATEDAAEQFGITIKSHEARSIADLQQEFSTIRQESVDGMLVFTDGLTYARRRDIIAFAASERLPTMYGSRESVDDGGLISYGVNLTAIYRRAATYIEKILKGAKAGDLPVEQPTILELIINLKTAKAIGLTIQESFLLRADEVLE
jgi:putative ABC transport system substrate-binding protein